MNGVLTSEKHVVEKIFSINESDEFSWEITYQQMTSNQYRCFFMVFCVVRDRKQKME